MFKAPLPIIYLLMGKLVEIVFFLRLKTTFSREKVHFLSIFGFFHSVSNYFNVFSGEIINFLLFFSFFSVFSLEKHQFQCYGNSVHNLMQISVGSELCMFRKWYFHQYFSRIFDFSYLSGAVGCSVNRKEQLGFLDYEIQLIRILN